MDGTAGNLFNKLIALNEELQAGHITSEEYEARMAQVKEEMDVFKEEVLGEFSEAITPYLEDNIPFKDPPMEVLAIETALFQRLVTHWSSDAPDSGHPSGMDFPPYFSLGAAALHGASHAYLKMLTEEEYFLEGGYGIHNTNAFELLEEGYEVTHDDYIRQIVILTMPLMNRFFWVQSKGWSQEDNHFQQYKRAVTEMYYDNLFDEPDGNRVTEIHSDLCMTLYEQFESDIQKTGDDSPYVFKPGETLLLARLLISDMDQQNVDYENLGDDDIFKIYSIVSLGMQKTAQILLEDWPNYWPYGRTLAPTYNPFVNPNVST